MDWLTCFHLSVLRFLADFGACLLKDELAVSSSLVAEHGEEASTCT
jgi:hypothetical protein